MISRSPLIHPMMFWLALGCVLTFSPGYAQKTLSSKQIKQRLSTLSGYPADSFSLYPSELKDFVIFNIGSEFGFISQDAKYLIQGEIINTETNINLTDNLNQTNNLNKIAQISSNLYISYPASQEKTKVWIFSDVNCFFCQKLHREMAELNSLGITVHYIAFPRSGQPNANDWIKSTRVWCAKDRIQAMNLAKRQRSVSTIPQQPNCEAQIALQYNTGQAIGVKGTPTIVLANGKTIPGYVPAKKLAKSAIESTLK